MSGTEADHNEVSCPDLPREKLYAVFFGVADQSDTDGVLEHLDFCKACQRLADELLTSEAENSQKRPDTDHGIFAIADSDEERSRRLLSKSFLRLSWPKGTGPGEVHCFGGHYEVIRLLATGGMSEVFECLDLRLGRRVAVKVLREVSLESNRLERLRREAMIQAGLKHPNIVAIHEVEFESFPPFIVMELMEGRTLREATRNIVPGPKTAARVVAGLARALDVAHQQGVIHRDIKPSNVLLAKPFDASIDSLDDAVIKLADFGLARQTDSQTGLTRSEVLAGTPAYMSPEQTTGSSERLNAQSDIYSLGVLFYELITGRPPLLTDNLELTLAMIREVTPVEPRQLRPNVSKDLNTICMKCLEKDPKSRYATAADLAADLESYLEGRGILARPVGPVVRLARWCRRNRSLAAWMALALVSVLILAVGSIQFGISQSRLLDRARTETNRALNAEREARAFQKQAEVMEAQAEAALSQAEESRQQALMESDLSRNFFFLGIKAIDGLADRIDEARKVGIEDPFASLASDARKNSENILAEFAKWPEVVSGRSEDSLAKLTPLQLERLFRDALALGDLGRENQCEALIREISRVCEETPASHPDYSPRRKLVLKCGAILSSTHENRGETDAALREIERVWALGSEDLDNHSDDREHLFIVKSIGLRYIQLLEKVGRKDEANQIREITATLPWFDPRGVNDPESIEP